MVFFDFIIPKHVAHIKQLPFDKQLPALTRLSSKSIFLKNNAQYPLVNLRRAVSLLTD